ncbi:AI-2E family transporter [Dactylosporangium salmoneum]|uniref:AI-2E family transporter n=1 Tax=Dactylosporangium salmoneum TaxID=53361 RepID=A0ABN3HVX1_9ACTN
MAQDTQDTGMAQDGPAAAGEQPGADQGEAAAGQPSGPWARSFAESSDRGSEAGQPAAQDIIELAEQEAEASRAPETPLGVPGRPLNRRSPFMVGLLGALGVATTYGLVQLVAAAREVLILIGLALFLAIGLDPFVRRLNRLMPRWLAVLAVTLIMLGIVGGFLAAAIPPLAAQTAAIVREFPQLIEQLQNRSSLLGHLNDRYQLQQRAEQALSGGGSGDLVNGVLGAGQLVLGVVGSTVTVVVLTIYFLADLPRIRQLIYRMVPSSRRARAILIGDEMFAKVGGFVLGNLITSLIAGVGTFIWLEIFTVPYPLVLSIMVALLDLIPVVGSTIGGIIVSAVALSVSTPVAIATAAFYIIFRLAEDYLLVPRIMGKAVEVSATVTFVAVLLGGAVLGIVGALIAIPIAAAARIILQETVFPRLDRT